jgi:hypothetical protein
MNDKPKKQPARKPIAFDEVVKRLLGTPPPNRRKPKAKRVRKLHPRGA